MASLKIVSDRCDDNAIKFAVVLPPRRNGEPNFAAAEAINRALLTINPAAFDPADQPTFAEQIALAEGVTATGAGFLDGVIVSPVMATAAIRDRVLETDDDAGAPGEPPRCIAGGCGDD